MRRTLVCLCLLVPALRAIAAAEEPDSQSVVLPLARILPAVASAAGVGGSFFKTSVQLFNPYTIDLHGRFVYHPAGVSGSSSDPGLDFTVPAAETLAYDDVVTAIGQTGLGTLDIMLPSASSSPLIVARVYDDAGTLGTSGFTEEAVPPGESGASSRIISTGTSGYLVLPSDLTRFRFNIGVRSLSTGAALQFTVRDRNGNYVGAFGKNYAATFFVQQEAGVYFGIPLPPDGTIRVAVAGGRAVIYGATIDNTTNDPSIQYVRIVSP
jgi:hypothetical protein